MNSSRDSVDEPSAHESIAPFSGTALGTISEVGRAGAPGRTWQQRYARRLLVIDILALTWVVFGVQLGWLGLSAREVAFSGTAFNVVGSYFTISALIIVGWVTVLTIFGSRQAKVVGGGSQEYRLVATATIWLFGLVAIVAYLLQIQLARGYILIAFPAGLFTLLFVRWLSRQWLRQERARGLYSSKVLLVGSISSTSTVAQVLLKNTDYGYVVMGACVSGVPSVSEPGAIARLPETNIAIVGGIHDAQSAMEAVGADTLIVTSADLLTPEEVRRLSWNLEPLRHNLIVAPSLMDVGGPRIHVRPVAGLPLLHIDSPVFEGRQKFAKRFFDVVVSSVLLVFLAPLMLVVALVVLLSSPGPIFYRQERIGLNQKPFHVWKFRTMVVDADDQLTDLLRSQEQGDVPFFKVKADPRILPAGRFLRRYSLDELPQIFNVLFGDMSLVGPRPQRDMEVALYDESARRRLLVQPGMTGLWQVSGRSNLSWEESIRLDLYYVENWSVMGDIILMWRTLRTVVLHTGAM